MIHTSLKQENNIFVFWESDKPIPAYLELCKKTWLKNIPNANIQIINYSNLSEYIGDIYDMDKLKTISLAMQSDIISAAVLEKFGGLFMDLDCIVTDNVFDILNSISKEKLVAFGFPANSGIHLAVLYCKTPQNPILTAWREEAQRRLNNKPASYKWDFFGNDIINPLLKDSKNKDGFHIIDRSASGNILESVAMLDSTPSLAKEMYKNFYFNEYTNISPSALDLVKCGVISLHNSWTPPKFKAIFDESLFLNTRAPIAEFLNYILNHDTKLPNRENLPILEGEIKSLLESLSTEVKTKYFNDFLVVDFKIENAYFAFDIKQNNQLFSCDLLFRFGIPKIIEDSNFNLSNIEKNKKNLISSGNKKELIEKIKEIYQSLSQIYKKSNNNLPIDKNLYIDLKSFRIESKLLFIEGIGLITNESAKEYSDINYKLIFKGKKSEKIITLAKAHKPEVTQIYSISKNLSYDKCWFTTPHHKGKNIDFLERGEYLLYLEVFTASEIKIEKITSTLSINFKNTQCAFSSNKNSNLLTIF